VVKEMMIMRPFILGLSASLALMGCNRQAEETTTDNADIAVEQNEGAVEMKLNQIGADIDRAAERAEREAKLAAEKAKQAATKGADKVERAAESAHQELQKDKE
jgi:uncharacterized lipoprotein NlpE involved in copper resistance